MRLTVRPGRLAISRLDAGAAVPAWATAGSFFSVTRTAAELSVVCAETDVPDAVRCERGWRALRVEGPLDFSLTGILAALAAPLADADIPIFALSTFDTDYLLVRAAHLDAAVETLRRAGHTV